MIAYQTTTAFLSLIVICLILWLIRKDHLHPRNALRWLVLSLAIGTVGLFPQTADWLADQLGVTYAPTLVLTIAILAILLKILRLDIVHSKDQQKIAALMQRIVVLEKRFDKKFDSDTH